MCNNETFSALEQAVSEAYLAQSPAVALRNDSELAALWLAKMAWLLACKSRMVADFRTRDAAEPNTILPAELWPGVRYLGMITRMFARGCGMYSCFRGDPPVPEFFYSPPYSVYIVDIEPDERMGDFDYFDDFSVLGAAIRFGSIGVICLFDGAVHETFRSSHYSYIYEHRLHPLQFAEMAARVFHDGSVVDPEALDCTYFWNDKLNAVVAQNNFSRRYNPYLDKLHVFGDLVARVAEFTLTNPADLVGPNGSFVSRLLDGDQFFVLPRTDAATADYVRRKSNAVLLGPLNAKWRHPPDRVPASSASVNEGGKE